MLTPLSCEEFAFRISEGTDKEGTGRTLTAKDFTVLSVSDYNVCQTKKVMVTGLYLIIKKRNFR